MRDLRDRNHGELPRSVNHQRQPGGFDGLGAIPKGGSDTSDFAIDKVVEPKVSGAKSNDKEMPKM